MSFVLRDYQARAIDQLWDWFRRHPEGHPVMDCCVSSGKSLMIAATIQRALTEYPDTRVIVIAHQKELIEQNLHKLRVIWPEVDVGVYSAALRSKQLGRQVTYSTIGSIYRHAHQMGRVHLLLADECHLISTKEAGMWRAFIADLQRYGNADVRVIGWTGTPYRNGGIWITAGKEALFSGIAARVTMSELLARGFLSPLVPVTTATRIDTSAVRTVAGDYHLADLAKASDQQELVESACAEIIRLAAKRRRWLVFAVSVEHAEHITAVLQAGGVRCGIVTGTTPAAEREAILADYQQDRLRCLVNVGIATTGFDSPPIDFIALLRATRSPTLFVQMCLDEQTEILTRDGWKRHGEVAIGEQVAGFDIATGEAKWQPVLAVVDRRLAPGEQMVEIQSPHLNMRVTADHNLVIKARRAKSWKLQKAREAMETRKDCSWLPIAACMNVPDCSLSDYEIRFIGWFLTDGSLNKKTNSITISQRESAKENIDILETLNGCGFRYGISKPERKGFVFGRKASDYEPSVRYRVNFGDARIQNGTGTKGWNRLHAWINKDIPVIFDKLSKRQLLLMLDAMNKANGNKSTQTEWVEKTMRISVGLREHMADRLQALCITRGIRCNKRSKNLNQFALLVSDKTIANIRGITRHDDNNNAILRKSETIQGEKVWCVTTPMGTIFTRRFGKAVIMGNCGRGMRLAEGKTDCAFADFTDTTATLGPVDAITGRLPPKKTTQGAPFKLCPECGGQNAAGASCCLDCSHEFPPPERIKHGVAATGAPILSHQAQPRLTVYPVSDVRYSVHHKEGSPPSLRVDYFSGLRKVASEWIHFERTGWARAKAERWWQRRDYRAWGVPASLAHAAYYLGNSQSLSAVPLSWQSNGIDEKYGQMILHPTTITVNESGKYPEIVGYSFDTPKEEAA